MLSRRQFLTSAATATAAALAPRDLLAALQQRTATLPDLSDWNAVRAQFAVDKTYLHFSSFFIASHPKPVRDAIEDYRKTLDANPYLTVDRRMFTDTDNLQLKIRDDLSGYLGAQRDEIALTGNTTTSLAIVYHGLQLEPGDEILTTTHDHYSHHESIRFTAERQGATTRRVALYDRASEANPNQMADRLRTAIKPATRVVGLTWVHSSTGVRLPIPALAQVVKDANRGRDEKRRILLVVDGVHGLGCVEPKAAELGADYFCAGTHKWMFAPRGTGIVWAKADRWALLRPTIPTFATLDAWNWWMNGETTPRTMTSYDITPGGFQAYEHQWATSAAFRFHEAIGRPRIAARIRALNDQCKAGLASIKTVRLHTPRDPELSAGICCFEVDGVKSDEVVNKLLEQKIIASTSPYKESYARLAPSLLNDPAEVDTALRAVRQIAGA
jgi:selenocysteine lyase/cysteine desulfurase